jgi:hypothetical protein
MIEIDERLGRLKILTLISTDILHLTPELYYIARQILIGNIVISRI